LVVRSGDIPEFRGKAPLERLFRARSERQRDYRLREELPALMGDTIVNTGPSEFDSYRDLPVLIQKLLAQGFAAADVGKILGGNYARVFAATVG
jgi:microsomal dipeptidase-like Zn-dependent dipeptidase